MKSVGAMTREICIFGTYYQICQMYQGIGACQIFYLITNVFYYSYLIQSKSCEKFEQNLQVQCSFKDFFQTFARNLANVPRYRKMLDQNLCYQCYVLFKCCINQKLRNDGNIFCFSDTAYSVVDFVLPIFCRQCTNNVFYTAIKWIYVQVSPATLYLKYSLA